MKKYKQAAASIAFLTVILTAGIYTGNPVISIRGDANVNQRQEEILDTIEEGDYRTWKKLVSQKGKIGNLVDESEFNEFILARKAARSGDYDKAIAIAEKIEGKLKEKIGLMYFS